MRAATHLDDAVVAGGARWSVDVKGDDVLLVVAQTATESEGDADEGGCESRREAAQQ